MKYELRPQVSMRLLFALVAIALLVVPSMFAQVERTVTIQGTVKDPSGAVVSGATVELTSPAIIAGKATVTTDSSGYYRFPELRPGSYTLTVTKTGFSTYKQTGIDLAVGRLPTIDVTLKVGATTEVVEVTGAAPQIDVATSRVQTNVTRDILDNIPKGRSFQSVIQFAPGARAEPLQGGSGGGLTQTLGYQIDGAATSENSYMVEGHETADIQFGTSTTNVPMEFTQEVVIKSAGFEAEHGGAIGGIVNVIQKRGSNSWHGSIFTYYRGSTLDAAPNRLYGNSYQPVKDHYRVWEPGFEVGGYLLKDKLWAFASAVPQLVRQERTVFMTRLNNNRRFSSDTDTYYSLARVDAQPWQKLRIYGTWQYNYQKNQGSSQPGPDDITGLSNPGGAGSNPDNYNHGIGYRAPSMMLGLGGDVNITPNLIFSSRWGRQYYNYLDVGLPVGIRYFYRNTSYLPNTPNGSYDPTIAPAPATTTALDGSTLGVACPTCVQASGFSTIGANFATIYDKYWRSSYSADLSYFHKGLGTHTFKFGYLFSQLSNNLSQGYNTAQLYVGYDRPWSPIVSAGLGCGPIIAFNMSAAGWPADPRSATCRGNWGTVNFREFGAFGIAKSFQHGIYVQDTWNVGHGVTLNLGVRFDKENLPSYSPGLPSINFGWGSKIAPRLGAAWDVMGNGKLKISGSFAHFYNTMKYDLPRGSFGGNYWHDCVYALDGPDFAAFIPVRGASGHFCEPTGGASSTSATPNPFGRTTNLIANEDFRIPSNDPLGACDATLSIPGSCVASLLALQPIKQHATMLGLDWQVRPGLALETRWVRRRLDRAIEDTGVIGPYGEQYSINNPGEGFNAIMYGPGLPPIPKAKRAYDGLEFRLTKAASSKWFGQLSYTYSRDYGNYTGSTNTDIADGGAGRQSQTGRAFDEPMGSFDAHGNEIDGPLPTDRPHTFKAAGYYRLKWWKMETVIGGFQQWYSGSALTSYVDVFGMNTMVEGRGKWIDFTEATVANPAYPGQFDYILGSIYNRRTPTFSQTDLSIVHEMSVSKQNERLKLGVEINFTNIFNQHSPTYIHSSVGEIHPFSVDINAGLPIGGVPQPPGPCNPVVTTNACNVDYVQLLTGAYDYVDELNGLGFDDTHADLNPLYGKPYGWQSPRAIRFKVKFTF